jgi:tetratricopeptide (TPR) repeat protein
MSHDPRDRKFSDDLKTVRFWMVLFLGPSGLVSTTVGFLKLIRGDFKLTSIALLLIGLCLCYSVLVYVRYSKILPSRTIVLTDDESQNSRRFKYSTRARRWALWAGLVMTALLTSAITIAVYYEYRAPRTMIILVADFDGPEPQNYRVTETIIDELRKATESFGDISVKPLNRVINPRDGRESAREAGRANKAAMVLWGWYGKTNDKVIVSSNFEILRQTRLMSLENERQISFFPEGELEAFTLQTQLSSKMTYLVLASVGTIRLEGGDSDAAIARFSAALDEPKFATEALNPSQIYYLRGRAYLRKNEITKAVSDFNKAIDITPDFVDAYVYTGVAYAVEGLYDPAISECDEALKHHPDSRLARLLRGLMWEVKLNRQRALSDYEAITKDDVGDDYLVTGLAFWRGGNTSKAIDVLTQGQINDPYNSSQYVLLRSRIMAEQKHFEEALRDVNEVLEAQPDQPYVLLIRANIFLLQGDVRNAITDCHSALKIHPTDRSAFFLLGQAHSAEKRFDRAIDDYTRLIELEPESMVGYFCRGSAYQEVKYFDEALKDYTDALRVAPDMGSIYLLRGFMYSKKKDFKRAIEDYDRALELRNEDSDAAEAFYYRGQAFLDQKNFLKAIEDFNHALRLRPDDVWIHATRGLAYISLEKYESAISDFNYVINRYPEEPIGYSLRSVGFMMESVDKGISPERKKELARQSEADQATSKGFFKKYDFDIDERNRAFRLFGLK